jgi:hypothetical protein
LWNLAKKSPPNTNRSKKMFAGYLATFMLRTKWKGKDGFKLFMQYAAKLYSEESTTDVTETKRLKSACKENTLYFISLMLQKIDINIYHSEKKID